MDVNNLDDKIESNSPIEILNIPDFSVVIPLYNKSESIVQTLDSVLNQSYQSFEIIIVDDESTDNSVNIIENRYNDPRIKIISQENQGEYGARNTGILNSQAKAIAFLDGDDEWGRDYLEEIHTLMQHYPEAGLYCTAYSQIQDGKNNERYAFGFQENDRGIMQSPLKNFVIDRVNPMSCSNAVIPRMVFQQIGMFAPTRGSGWDWEMWVRVILNYPIAYSAKNLVKINICGDNRLSNVPQNMQLDEHPVIIYLDSLNENELSASVSLPELILFRDYINVVFADMWITTGGDGQFIRKILTRINNKNIFKKEIIYGYVQSFTPIFLRGYIYYIAKRVQNIMSK